MTDGRSGRRATEGPERDEEEERDSLRFQTRGGGGVGCGGRKERVARDAWQSERGREEDWKHGSVDRRVIILHLPVHTRHPFIEPSTCCRSAHAVVAIAAGEKEKDGCCAVGPCESKSVYSVY